MNKNQFQKLFHLFLANRNYVWLPLHLSILIIAISFRFIQIYGDQFNVDDYAMMKGINKPFADYVEDKARNFGISMPVHYWLTNRLIGGDIRDYLLLPALSSIFALIILYICLQYFLPRNQFAIFLALLIITYNAYSVRLAQYAMLPYSNSLSFSIILLFLFWRLSKSEISWKAWLGFTILFIPMAFFSTFTILAFAASGILSVIIYRLLLGYKKEAGTHKTVDRSIERDSLAPKNNSHLEKQFIKTRFLQNDIIKKVSDLYPLLIIPLIKFVVIWFYPLKEMGEGRREDIAYLFFNSVDYSGNISGVFSYIFNNTSELTFTLYYFTFLKNPSITLFFSDYIKSINLFAALFIIASIVAAIILFFIKRKRKIGGVRLEIEEIRNAISLDDKVYKINFVIVLFLVTLCSICFAGLLGLFPYGRVRYAYFLIVPGILIISYLLSNALGFFTPLRSIQNYDLEKTPNRPKFVTIILSLLILTAGFYYSYTDRNRLINEKIQNYKAISLARQYKGNNILYTGSIGFVLRVKAPHIFKAGINIGKGYVHRHRYEKVPSGTLSIIETKADSILLITDERSLEKRYPQWHRLISRHFKKNKTIKATNIWLEYYSRKV